MRRAIALAMLAAILLAGCSGQASPNRYHVTCYQFGEVVFDRSVVLRWEGVIDYWADAETGYRVRIPKNDGASCIWVGEDDGTPRPTYTP